MNTTLGKIYDETNELYHASKAVSHSKLETFRRRPILYKKQYIDGTLEKPSSAAFLLGSALHCAVLEPGEFSVRYAQRPNVDRRTKDGKAQYEAFVAQNEGRQVLDADDYSTVLAMRRSIQLHPAAAKLLDAGEPEITWRVAHAGLPVPLQCRTDWINEKDGYVADVKTVSSLGNDDMDFARTLAVFGYHRQAAYYLDLLAKCGLSDLKWYFVVVEKCEPFGTIVFELDQQALEVGAKENQQDLFRLTRAYAEDIWINTPSDIQALSLPGWYKSEATQ
jgi:exodeoxyribonuclease VIII